jgi:hypothetical protein
MLVGAHIREFGRSRSVWWWDQADCLASDEAITLGSRSRESPNSLHPAREQAHLKATCGSGINSVPKLPSTQAMEFDSHTVRTPLYSPPSCHGDAPRFANRKTRNPPSPHRFQDAGFMESIV